MRKKNSDEQVAALESLASALSKIVQERGVKLKWIATKANLDPSYVSLVLNGSKPGSLSSLMAMARPLGLELNVAWKEKRRSS